MKKMMSVSCILFALIAMFSLRTNAQYSIYANTLGAKIFINHLTPVKFLSADEIIESSSCEYYGDSILYESVKGGFSYEVIVCIIPDCSLATIYIWNNDKFEVWERPIPDSEKTITEFIIDENGKVTLYEKPHSMPDEQLKNRLLGKISLNLITAQSEMIDTSTQIEQFKSIKRKLRI